MINGSLIYYVQCQKSLANFQSYRGKGRIYSLPSFPFPPSYYVPRFTHHADDLTYRHEIATEF